MKHSCRPVGFCRFHILDKPYGDGRQYVVPPFARVNIFNGERLRSGEAALSREERPMNERGAHGSTKTFRIEEIQQVRGETINSAVAKDFINYACHTKSGGSMIWSNQWCIGRVRRQEYLGCELPSQKAVYSIGWYDERQALELNWKKNG